MKMMVEINFACFILRKRIYFGSLVLVAKYFLITWKLTVPGGTWWHRLRTTAPKKRQSKKVLWESGKWEDSTCPVGLLGWDVYWLSKWRGYKVLTTCQLGFLIRLMRLLCQAGTSSTRAQSLEGMRALPIHLSTWKTVASWRCSHYFSTLPALSM